MNDTKTLKISESVQWIGVLDADIRTFDIVMETKYGTTYNSYLINAEKKAIVDASKEKYWDAYLEKIKSLINPEEIEYIIVNHTEPDHSGNVGNLLKIAPNAKVVGSGNAIKYLNDLLGYEFPNIVVKDGDSLDLGNKILKFIGAINLHWPDSIYTYLEEEKVLFTCDSFGAHYCNEAMFDDLCPNFDEAFKYYFDVILKPFSKFYLKAIEKIRPLEINAICPGHGPVLRSYWKKYVDLSEDYATTYLNLTINNRVFIPFVSAYGNTAQIAAKIAEGIKSAGNIEVILMDIEKTPLSVIDEMITCSRGLVVGSPTINKNTLNQIYQMFSILNPLRDFSKMAAVFGSYGWSGEALDIIKSSLANLKFKIFEEPFGVKFTLHQKDESSCFDFGRRFGLKFIECTSKE